ncbi:FkbM family methyltransferase [Zobellella aerophila]|uniref:Methyltransferase FkbM domain-containing protein n=1 Tax=Zobellella aerophila TaxID=870480 RepID=A0ABP6V3R9_9GAMM
MTIHIPHMLNTLVHIGAGKGNDNKHYQHAQRLVLIEPSPQDATALRQIIQTNDNVSLYQLAIADNNGSACFNLYNWHQASSLYPASGLTQLMPGLKIQQVIDVQTRTLATLLNDVQLTEEGNNLLIIDAPGAERLITEQLARLDQHNPFAHIILYCPSDPHYSSDSNSTEVLSRLYQQGYELIAKDNSDPDRPAYTLYRNTLKLELHATEAALSEAQKDRIELQQKLTEQAHQLAAVSNAATELKQQLGITNKANHGLKQAFSAIQSEHKKQLAELQRHLDDAKQANSELTQRLAMAEQANNKWQQTLANTKTDHEQQTAELRRRLDETSQANDDLKQQLVAARQDSNLARSERDRTKEICDALKQTLAMQEKESACHKDMQKLIESNQQIADTLEEKTKKIITEQAQKITTPLIGLKNQISNGLANTAKQIECFIGIQNYLEKGSKPLSFHGWPISPDLGLYLIGLIDANDYDCIIEFGSGTSTLLMAKALQRKQYSLTTKNIKKKSKTKNKKQKTNKSNYNTLPHIISFEHDIIYHRKTTKLLSDNNIEHLVELVHAPLVDYQYTDDTQFLYYDCQETLNKLAVSLKEKKANIMVLVDGPPGATNKNARFPALPNLIQSLPDHQLTLVMDDYNRPEEQEIIELWRKITTDHDFIVEVIACEKGLAILNVL